MAGQTIQVSILADTKKFSSAMRNLSKETGLDKLGSAFKTAGSKVSSFFKNGIKLAGAFSLAIAGMALKGGFERALKIEDAQAKLKGLGHDAKSIDTIMDSALASVKGTAAGLDEAATMAASAVAAGIEPGQELTEALSLVNDAATIAGTGMSEMGSIFSKVWTSGRAQTTELNQIADRGIPIWTELAEHYGVSADELRKMVSRGEVDAATFEKVMTDVVGGSALEAGNTTRGAFANMRAALSRTGEAFLKEIFPLFRESFTGITSGLDAITPHAERAGQMFADWIQNTAVPAVQSLWSWVQETLVPALREFADYVQDTVVPALEEFADWITDTVVPALEDLADWVDENKEKLAAAAVVIATFITSLMAFNQVVGIIRAVTVAFTALNAVMLANPIGLIVAAVAALIAGLVLFFTQTETGQAIWETAWAAIQAAAQVVADWFTGTALPALQAAWDGIVAAADAAGAWFMEHVAPVFQAAGELIVEVWNLVWGALQDTWAAIGEPVMFAIGVAVDVLRGIWDVAWNAISTIAVAAWDIIRTSVETALGVIEGIIRTITAAIRGDWSAVWEEIKGIASTVWDGISSIVDTAINAVWDIITGTLDSILQTWKRVWGNVEDALSRAWENVRTTVSDGVADAAAFVGELPGRILDALGDLSGLLTGAAGQVIDGFIGGIQAGFGRVRDKLGELTGMLPNWKGPAAKDRTILKDAGQLVIQGFIGGLESQYGAVKSSLASLVDDVATTPFEAPTPAMAGTAVGSSGFGGAGAGGGGADPVLDQIATVLRDLVQYNAQVASRPVSVSIDGQEVYRAVYESDRGMARRGGRVL